MTAVKSEEFSKRLNSAQIPALNGIRVFAVILVIIHHLGISNYHLGSLGVIAFFVLSGFLITWLILGERDRTGGFSVRNFYIRRTLRIWPAFYVFGLCYIVIALALHRKDPWDQYAAALLFFNNYYRWLHPAPHVPLDHMWSLAVEEQFYLLWPWICLRNSCDRAKLKRLLMAAISLIWIGRAIYVAVATDSLRTMVVRYSFHTRADALAIGCLIAVSLHGVAMPGWAYRLMSRPWYPLITLAALCVLVYPVSVLPDWYADAVGLTVWPCLFAVLMIQLIGLSGHRGWRWVDSAWANAAGKLTYAAYLWHWIVAYVLINRFYSLIFPFKLAIATLVSFAIAGLSYRFVERPFLNMRSRFHGAASAPAS